MGVALKDQNFRGILEKTAGLNNETLLDDCLSPAHGVSSGGSRGGEEETATGTHGDVAPDSVVFEKTGGGTGKVDEQNIGVLIMVGLADVYGRTKVLTLQNRATRRVGRATQFHPTRQPKGGGREVYRRFHEKRNSRLSQATTSSSPL
jgi:hypothetical protein